MTTRLSGTLANRPEAAAAQNCFYLVMGQPMIFTVDFNGQAGTLMGGRHFETADANGDVYFWFNTGGSTDPSPGGRGIEVALSVDDTDVDIASKLAAVVDPEFKFSVEGTKVTIESTAIGSHGTSNTSGATVLITQPGVAGEGVFIAVGDNWLPRESLDESDNNGLLSGLDAEKPDPRGTVGYIYHATDTGIKYEAFPDAWFALP